MISLPHYSIVLDAYSGNIGPSWSVSSSGLAKWSGVRSYSGSLGSGEYGRSSEYMGRLSSCDGIVDAYHDYYALHTSFSVNFSGDPLEETFQ